MADNQQKKQDLTQEVAKKKLFTRIITGQLNFKKKKKTSSFDSVKDKSKNLIDFMLTMIETLKGKSDSANDKIDVVKDSLPPIVLTLLVSVLARLLPTMQQKVLDLLMRYLKDNCALDTVNLSIPNELKTGLHISSRSLDIFRILKEDYNSKSGQIFFGGDNANSFAALLRKAALNPGTPYNYPLTNVIDTTILYTAATDKFTFTTTNTTGGDVNLKDFFVGMLQRVMPFTPATFIGLACDTIYGTLSKKVDTTLNSLTQARTADDITNDEYINTIIENYLEYDLDDIIETDTFYTFTDEQKGLIEGKINSRFNGEGGFVASCGEVEASIQVDQLTDELDTINGATKSSEVKVIGQSLNNLGDLATTNLNNDDKDTGKKGFFNQLIKLFPVITTKMFLSPDIVFTMEVAKIIKNQASQQVTASSDGVKSGKEFFQKNSQIMREISKEFYGQIMTELYLIVKDEIKKLIVTQVKAIVAEKAKNYLRIILSGIEGKLNKAIKT
tara:strand:- start:1107 stop:2609 length:1503 start_codon:yes stop_codon:yes gene_type:complete